MTSQMIIPFIFTTLGMIFLAIFLFYRSRKSTAGITILKSCTSIGFTITAVSSILCNPPSNDSLLYYMLVLMGLFFGLLGDIWLDLKYAHRASMKIYTNSGFICFLIGHVMFVSAMIHYYYQGDNILRLIIPGVLAVVAAAVSVALEKPMGYVYGDFKLITFVYSVFLYSLPFYSQALAHYYGFKNIVLDMMSIAGLFFLISDIILSGTYFGKGKNRPVDIVTNHITYYIAQYTIALTLCFFGKTI